jgi:hypothetical protein
MERFVVISPKRSDVVIGKRMRKTKMRKTKMRKTFTRPLTAGVCTIPYRLENYIHTKIKGSQCHKNTYPLFSNRAGTAHFAINR